METTGISNPPPLPPLIPCSLSAIITPSPLSLPLSKSSAWCINSAPVLSFDRMITVYSLIFIYCTSCEAQKQIPPLYLSLILGLSLSEEHCMYPLHFMQCRVQPDPPLSGCYYGDASRAKTKAEQKLSSLRQEPLAELWQPNLAWQQRLEPSLSLSLFLSVSLTLCLSSEHCKCLFPSKYWLREINELTWLIKMKGREFITL